MSVATPPSRARNSFNPPDSFGRRTHRITLKPSRDAAAQPGGSIAITGLYPTFELLSSRGALPTSWCWLNVDVRDANGLLAPSLAITDAESASETTVCFANLPVGRTRLLLLLPAVVQRIDLTFRAPVSGFPLAEIRLEEVGKLRLLWDLVRYHPSDFAASWKASRSLAELKVDLVKRREQSSRPDLPAWLLHYRRAIGMTPFEDRGFGRISVILLAFEAEAAVTDAALQSIEAQDYDNWELFRLETNAAGTGRSKPGPSPSTRAPRVHALHSQGSAAQTLNAALRAATGDLVLVLDANDRLLPHALGRFADAAAALPSDLFYADAIGRGDCREVIDRLNARSAFSHDHLMSSDDTLTPWAMRADVAQRLVDDDNASDEVPGIDLLLRAAEIADSVTHLPDILAERVGRPPEAAMGAVAAVKTDHLHRLGFTQASVVAHPAFGTFTTTYHGAPSGRILAVIPTKNGIDLLRQCIDTVRASTSGLVLDLVVVDHESSDPRTCAYLDDLRRTGKATVIPYAGVFNYAAINNAAVRRCATDHDYLLFLNNDIEARQPGWLHAMVDLAMRADVGAVGATLLYPDHRIQHTGVVVGMQGHAEHLYKFMDFAGAERAGLLETRDFSAVTGACMLVSAAAFNAVGGFDEQLVVGFNDVDLCLRIRQHGLRVLGCAEAVLIHHESASRGRATGDPHPSDSAFFAARYEEMLEAGDPYFSPFFDRNDYTQRHTQQIKVHGSASDPSRTTRHIRPEVARPHPENAHPERVLPGLRRLGTVG